MLASEKQKLQSIDRVTNAEFLCVLLALRDIMVSPKTFSGEPCTWSAVRARDIVVKHNIAQSANKLKHPEEAEPDSISAASNVEYQPTVLAVAPNRNCNVIQSRPLSTETAPMLSQLAEISQIALIKENTHESVRSHSFPLPSPPPSSCHTFKSPPNSPVAQRNLQMMPPFPQGGKFEKLEHHDRGIHPSFNAPLQTFSVVPGLSRQSPRNRRRTSLHLKTHSCSSITPYPTPTTSISTPSSAASLAHSRHHERYHPCLTSCCSAFDASLVPLPSFAIPSISSDVSDNPSVQYEKYMYMKMHGSSGEKFGNHAGSDALDSEETHKTSHCMSISSLID